jgi:Niemann-Pick C1 protein
VFFAWLCISIAVAPKIEAGLDQDLSVPEDSHVLKYFNAMYDYLSVGPPVYFVVKDTGLNYSDIRTQEVLRAGDFPWSLVSQIYSASKLPNRTYIAKPSQSWIDDFIDWARVETCCKYYNNTGYFCPSSNP